MIDGEQTVKVVAVSSGCDRGHDWNDLASAHLIKCGSCFAFLTLQNKYPLHT